MNPGRPAFRGALALTLLACAACAGLRNPRLAGQPAASSVGIYSGRLHQRGEASRPFRLMLFVAQPDRVHGEILSPLGTPEIVLDGGQGRLAITWLDERVTYQGPASPEALARVLGLPLGLREWVRSVLTGDIDPDQCRVRRSPDPDGALPESLEIEAGGSRLTLRLKRLRRLPAGEVELGTGAAPAGTEIRALVDLPHEEF